ncbi:MAG: alkaline phosphatase family protein, partial [Bacteroidales bacterium]|nr:alkaline phosphatase family protein [Bacteroidales bacterium]
TISTGTEPSRHGITSDYWYLPLRDELVYCTKDIAVDPVGGSYESGLHSPVSLNSSTFTDELKMATNRKARVFSVGLKESSVILSAGHAADGAFWYDRNTGTWMSSTYYGRSLPGWVNDFNAANHAVSYLNTEWKLLRSAEYYTDCQPDSNNYEAGFRSVNYFPYDLKKLSMTGRNANVRDMSLLMETPFGNSLTTDFALKLIAEEDLGSDDVPDFLSVCYSATDYIGHRFGPSSYEMADAILRLDRDIENLMKYLNDKLGKRNILVYFTSAHGVAEIPAVLEKSRIPSGYFRQNQALQLLRSYMNALYGEGDWVRGYVEKQFYLNRTLIEDARIPLEDVQKKVARFIVQFTGVASAHPYSAFAPNDFGNGSIGKIINNYSPQRSGDIIITLNPGWVERHDEHVTDHSSPYDYDSHVPLIWYGWAVNRQTVTRKVNMTGIAVTLSSLCRIPYPNASTGEPMFELFR